MPGQRDYHAPWSAEQEAEQRRIPARHVGLVDDVGDAWQRDMSGDILHRLLLEREELLGERVKERYRRLEQVEKLLKDAIDDAGHAIVDEELGQRVDYQHSSSPIYDMERLAGIVPPDAYDSVFVTTASHAALKALINRGRLTERELRPAIKGTKPIRGVITVTRVSKKEKP